MTAQNVVSPRPFVSANQASPGPVMNKISHAPVSFDPRHTELHTVLLMPPGEARNALALSLWDVGMLVTVFATPREAEGVLVGENVHAVLMDAGVGVIVGPALVSWLRAAGRGQVKVVIVGNVEAGPRDQLLAQGVAHVVPYPPNPKTFAQQFARALGTVPRAA